MNTKGRKMNENAPDYILLLVTFLYDCIVLNIVTHANQLSLLSLDISSYCWQNTSVYGWIYCTVCVWVSLKFLWHEEAAFLRSLFSSEIAKKKMLFMADTEVTSFEISRVAHLKGNPDRLGQE